MSKRYMLKKNARSTPQRGKYSTVGEWNIKEEVIRAAQMGDADATEYILRKYKDFVRMKAKPYFLRGGMKEDLVQEGMIGLYQAIRDYDMAKQTSFKSFAELCIRRQIWTAVTASTRKKHNPLNRSVSLSILLEEWDYDHRLSHKMAGLVYDPEEMLIGKENFFALHKRLHSMLSPFERKVFHLYLEGLSYIEISRKLGKHSKSIDNALQRIKRKLEKLIEVRN